MPVICPKCRHVRQPSETTPDWQCPACGVCYAKVAEGAPQPRPGSMRSASAPVSREGSIPWRKLILVAALAWGAWTGVKVAKNKHGGAPDVETRMSAEVSAADLGALAATVKPGDVTMYSTTECAYCTQAKGWLHQYGFAFTECNMSVQPACESEFKHFGATGTPYLVVRGRHMKDGFDSDEFISLLTK